jgi:arsenate reductase
MVPHENELQKFYIALRQRHRNRQLVMIVKVEQEDRVMEKRSRPKKVLFICTHNSARSHMAEGLVNALYADRYRAFSAGTEPSTLNPYAVRVMHEIGIDISGHRSKSVDEFMDQDLDDVVTVCDHAKESCPFFPGGRKSMHKGFQDPASVTGTEEEKLQVFRRVRDEMRHWVERTFGAEDGPAASK